MKTTHQTHTLAKLTRLFRWTAFVSALGATLALFALLTGCFDGKLANMAPAANESWQQYAVNNADISAIFQCW